MDPGAKLVWHPWAKLSVVKLGGLGAKALGGSGQCNSRTLASDRAAVARLLHRSEDARLLQADQQPVLGPAA